MTTHGYNRTQETLKEVREGGVLQSKAEYTYDLEGRMLSAKVTTYTSGTPSRIERSTYAYDASGIRVSALVEIDADANGTYETATKSDCLNDPENHTGYSQVLAETTTDLATSQVQKRVEYTLGLDRISQTATTYSGGAPQSTETLFFGQDGHGSTRVLFNAAAAIATVAGTRQLFHYDAFGNALGFNAAQAATSFLYSGEQTDSTGLQYLRARYYDPASGRFNGLDPFAGNVNDPQSLHKYLYCHGDPINGIDPTGQSLLGLFEGITEGVEFELQRATQALSALRSAYSIQRLVSIYQAATSAYAEIGFKAAQILVRSGPVIQTVTTYSGYVFLASTTYLILEQYDYVPRTGYTEFVVAASSLIFTEGFALGEVVKNLRGIIEPLRGTGAQDGRLLTGAMANEESLGRHPGYTSLPYRPYTPAAEGRLAPGTGLVRFWRPGVANREGAFTAFAKDVEGLSFAEVQRKFALPYLPTNRAYADGSNARAVIGIAGRNFGMPGNGRQVELIDRVHFTDAP